MTRVVNSHVAYPSSLGHNVSIVNSTIGRYCGFSDNAICQNARVGAFCCVAYGAAINPFQHPVRWLSSHGFQYHRGGFEDVDEYAALEKLPYPGIEQRDVIIGNDVWIGHNASVMASVGDGAIIGAGAVVTKDVPPYAVAVGNPAEVKYYRFVEDIIARLLELRWWNMPLHMLSGLPFDDVGECINELERRIADRKEAAQPRVVA